MNTTSKYLDLHLHLDGAITMDIAKKLAALQNIELPKDEELEKQLTVSENCTSLNDFLKCFKLPISLLETREAITEAVVLVAENIKSHGVVYAEFRFAPSELMGKGLSQEEVLLAALEGVKKAGIHVNLIVSLMRGNQSNESMKETIELVKKYRVEDGGVVALDLAGAEALYPLKDYKFCFDLAKEYNIPFTIHAGEADGAHSVKTAIEYGARRIGHGVRSYEDEEVIGLLKEKGIFLEMCPTSNHQTHALEDMSKYPIMDYLHKGIKVTLNTDDMAIEGIDIRHEFAFVERNFGLTSEEKRQILENSIEAAFTSEEVKEELRKIVFES